MRQLITARAPVFLVSAGCLLICVIASPVSAQSYEPLRPGTLVRISHNDRCCRSPSVGTLVSVGADSVVIQQPGALGVRLALRRASVNAVETRHDIGGRAVAGAILGLVAGAAVGVVYGLASACRVVDDICIWPLILAYTGGIGAAAGLVVGAVIGAQIRHVVWLTVPVPAQVGFGPSPGGGTAIRLTLYF